MNMFQHLLLINPIQVLLSGNNTPFWDVSPTMNDSLDEFDSGNTPNANNDVKESFLEVCMLPQHRTRILSQGIRPCYNDMLHDDSSLAYQWWNCLFNGALTSIVVVLGCIGNISSLCVMRRMGKGAKCV